MPSLAFKTYDVFTDRRFSGNPLAVVTGGEALDTAALQRIAQEFNLSETIFVMPPENPAHSARVRIFTPTLEMPFAGHPTIGCAIHLALERFGPDADIDSVIVLEENVGPVRCAVRLKPGAPTFAQFDSPRLAESIGDAPGDTTLAAALGIPVEQIGFRQHQPSAYSAGAPYVFAPVANLTALAACRPMPGLVGAVGASVGLVAYTALPTDSPHAFRVRMFAPGAGVVEDPATGSAAAAMAGVVARYEGLSDGYHHLPIEQGVEMGRPSLIALEVDIKHGTLIGARIGGGAVSVSEGRIEI